MKDYYCVECGCELLALGEAEEITYYTCEICGHTYEERHNLYAEHKYKGTVTNPTCTEAGHTSFVCETCNHSYIDNITSAT